jgi:hypothetical protein
MSLSINKLFETMATAKNVYSKVEGFLQNPDIPSPKDFDDALEIRDKAYSAFKLTTQPRNGNYFMLPRTAFSDDPRKDSFLQENAIDPNIIRKKVNPDAAMPDLRSGTSTLFSLEKSNVTAQNSINLIQQAHKSYMNYKNRFESEPEQQSTFKENYPKISLMTSNSKYRQDKPTQAGEDESVALM